MPRASGMFRGIEAARMRLNSPGFRATALRPRAVMKLNRCGNKAFIRGFDIAITYTNIATSTAEDMR